MSEKKEVIRREIDWGAFWKGPVGLSEEDRHEFRKLFQVDRKSLQVPFGPADGSGNWQNSI